VVAVEHTVRCVCVYLYVRTITFGLKGLDILPNWLNLILSRSRSTTKVIGESSPSQDEKKIFLFDYGVRTHVTR